MVAFASENDQNVSSALDSSVVLLLLDVPFLR